MNRIRKVRPSAESQKPSTATGVAPGRPKVPVTEASVKGFFASEPVTLSEISAKS
ncbi:MAG: hypothetical protein IPL39_17670 [Opitutaceae bacterium]|nr:hypothetical protein [Opitutaceae bacterium]